MNGKAGAAEWPAPAGGASISTDFLQSMRHFATSIKGPVSRCMKFQDTSSKLDRFFLLVIIRLSLCLTPLCCDTNSIGAPKKSAYNLEHSKTAYFELMCYFTVSWQDASLL